MSLSCMPTGNASVKCHKIKGPILYTDTVAIGVQFFHDINYLRNDSDECRYVYTELSPGHAKE